MSVRDIILDRVKDRLFCVLHYESDDSGAVPPLKGWQTEYVSDLIDLTFVNNGNAIYKIIAEEIENKNLTLEKLSDDVIEQIVKKIKPVVLVLDDQEDVPYAGENAPTLKPAFPFNSKSLLQFCWGTTLNLSHETQQQTLGSNFNTQFSDEYKQIFSPRLTANVDDPNSIFFLNLQMAMTSTIRNLAFIRITHSEYLSFNADRLGCRRQHLEDIADWGSNSSSSIFAKAGSIIGVGSAADLATFYQNLKAPLIFIPIFALFGLAGALVMTLAVRYYVNRTDDEWDRQMKKEQNRYWKEHYKKDVTNELYDLYISILGLIGKFYPAPERDAIINNDELLKYSEYPEYVKLIIKQEILPPDDLQWFPTSQSTQASSQAGSGQSPASGSKGKDKSTNGADGNS